jgi:hypothetical protein
MESGAGELLAALEVKGTCTLCPNAGVAGKDGSVTAFMLAGMLELGIDACCSAGAGAFPMGVCVCAQACMPKLSAKVARPLMPHPGLSQLRPSRHRGCSAVC